MVILITGKKGAGKTHYAQTLQEELEAEHFKVKHLDGDEFRRITQNDDFSDDGRRKNLKKAAELAAEYEAKGFLVLMSFVMPTRSFRNMIRKHFDESRVVYVPGGTLWKNTTYERPTEKEMEVLHSYSNVNNMTIQTHW